MTNSDAIALDVSDAWLNSVHDRLTTSFRRRRRYRGSGDAAELSPTISRVPAHIRKHDEGAYDPNLVSLGPYHHRGTSGELQSMEERKWRYLYFFLAENPARTLNDLLQEMAAIQEQARRCYSDPIDMGTEGFAEMLLLDGGFVVQLLLMSYRNLYDGDDPVTSTSWFLAGVVMDMLLLENQLPFFVLQRLYDSATASWATRPPGGLVAVALQLFRRFVHVTTTASQAPEHVVDAAQVHHLLHLFRSTILPTPSRPEAEAPGRRSCIPLTWLGLGSPSSLGKSPAKAVMHSIPTAVQLSDAGVKFRKKEHQQSPLDVAFRDGAVEMSPVAVFDHTGALFQNLIAFEQLHVGQSKRHVTSYAIFMDSLVDKSGDVELLQKEGVLVNGLGSEAAAAELFNRLGKNIVESSFEDNHLAEFFRDVNEHCNARWPRWRATLVRDYFSNPWSFIAFAAAALGLILTVVGTIYTALAYLNPKPGA